ncbi:MAG: translocation/assembly module TamB domain-containing protein [Paracoccaceae bacterium]
MRWFFSFLLISIPFVALAQETEAERTDRNAIVSFIEDNLSGTGRQVILRGFEGALSSRATATQLTIADEDGVWLTLNDIVLDWTRSALLSGRVSINELTAAEIILDRAPKPETATPSPEASGFSLPELPVSVEIAKISAPRVVLGEALVGQSVEGSVDAAVSLAGGDGSADLTIIRTDAGPDGRIHLVASYAKETRRLSLSLDAAEGAGGIAAGVLSLPGQPSVDLTVTGDGPLDDFRAEIGLTSGGAERLAGNVTLKGSDTGGMRFNADVGGDLAPLFIPAYADFLGDTVTLVATGQRSNAGRIDLSALDVRARSVELRGQAKFAADGLPELVALNGFLRDPDGKPVVIPGFDAGVSVRTARIEVAYNAVTDESWRAVVEAEDLITPDGTVGKFDLRGSGRISRSSVGRSVGGSFTADASGIAPSNADLAMALGETVTATTRVWWQEGAGSVRIAALDLTAGALHATANAEISGLESGFQTKGRLRVEASDLAPLSGLAGRALAGRGIITAEGEGSPLGGEFDVTGRIDGEDLSVDMPQIDGLLRGPSSISADLRRDTTGTLLREFTVRAVSLEAAGKGTVTSNVANLEMTLHMDELSRLGPAYGGGVAGDLRLSGPLTDGRARIVADLSGTALRIGIPEADRVLNGDSRVSLVADLDGDHVTFDQLTVTAPGVSASVKGVLAASGRSDLRLQATVQDLSRVRPGYGGSVSADATFLGTLQTAELTVAAEANSLRVGQSEADRILAGTSTLTAALRLDQGALRVDDLRLTNPQVSAQATGRLTQDRRDVDLSARLTNLGLLLPEFPGPVTVTGTAVDTGNGYDLSLSGTGPGQIDARATGRVAANLAQADLTVRGSAQAGLANPFLGNRVVTGPLDLDLRLNGPLALSSLSGRVTLTQGRLADPSLPFSLQGIEATANLSGGSAQIAATAAVSTGGTLSATGPVSLTAPFPADLGVTVSSVVLRDPQFYETRANGQLRVTGPLAGGALVSGRIALPQTEIRVSATGLGGEAMIDGLRHVGDRPSVRETRRRAGLLGDGANGGNGSADRARRPFGLDVEISAPNQLFVRGRGLDAELGGTVRLTGTTDAVVPSGAFNLIRGRLDILGRRLTLSEAMLQLGGDFDASLRVVASSVNNGVTSSVVIEGSLSDPQVSFTSSPQMPQEEVLSQLLFGRRLDSLSAFQALQLANAVATLAGRSGEGIVSRLRQGFGLDDLDVQTDDNGNAQLTAGKYLSEKIYSEIVVDQQGKSQINLNLDLTDSVTIKGRVGADGNTGIGLFYEKDY